jgi:hypothetical protein
MRLARVLSGLPSVANLPIYSAVGGFFLMLCSCELLWRYTAPFQGTDSLPAADLVAADLQPRDLARDGRPLADLLDMSLPSDSLPDLSLSLPQITSVSFEPCVKQHEVSVINVTAVDLLGGDLSYAWSASDGDLRGKGNKINLTAPNPPIPCPITVEVVVTSLVSNQSITESFEIYFILSGDFDQDGDVDQDDLDYFTGEYGLTECCAGGIVCLADFDHDCDVDETDLATFNANTERTDGCACL